MFTSAVGGGVTRGPAAVPLLTVDHEKLEEAIRHLLGAVQPVKRKRITCASATVCIGTIDKKQIILEVRGDKRDFVWNTKHWDCLPDQKPTRKFEESSIRALTHCSFCGRANRETGPHVEGPIGVYICAKCVDVAVEIVRQLREEGKIPR